MGAQVEQPFGYLAVQIDQHTGLVREDGPAADPDGTVLVFKTHKRAAKAARLRFGVRAGVSAVHPRDRARFESTTPKYRVVS